MSRRLEEKPLDEGVSLLLVRDSEPLLGVVLVDEVKENGIGLPDDEVAVLMVDDGGDPAIWVQFGMFGRHMLVLEEIQVDRFVGKSELFEEYCYLPKGTLGGMGRGTEKELPTSHWCLKRWCKG